MKPLVVGVAGGSGTGKSTLAVGLQNALPDQTVLIQLDDYFLPSHLVPSVAGFPNYDSPEAVNFVRMAKDIHNLKNGRSVRVHVKDPSEQGHLGTHATRVWIIREPRVLIIVEGFLVLGQSEIRELLDLKIFLSAAFDLHLSRRIHFMDEGYAENVLRPMHTQYVEPSKKFADHIIQVGEMTPDRVKAAVVELIQHAAQ